MSNTNKDTKYLYHFFVWPDETRGRLDNDGMVVPQAVFKLFEMIDHNIEMEFTALEFVRFRHDIESFGLTLREISRVPYQQEETVL